MSEDDARTALEKSLSDQRDFYQMYGIAMGTWAEFEHRLGGMFIAITKMPEGVGRTVWLSARSFQGRYDMLRVMVPLAKTVPAGRSFLNEMLSKAKVWQNVRNSLAHDLHTRIVAIDGSQSKFAIASKGSPYIEDAQLKNAGIVFLTAALALDASRGSRKLLREPELCVELLTLLPKDALATAVDQTKVGPLLKRIRASSD